MTRSSEEAKACTIAASLRVLGEKWTLLVIRECFYGSTRFQQFQSVLECPRNLLADRLRMLVDEGVLDRSPYREPGKRARDEYHLTPKGRELLPVLLALMDWGDRHEAGPGAPPVVARHVGCGERLHVALLCADGHRVSEVGEAELVAGPSPRDALGGARAQVPR